MVKEGIRFGVSVLHIIHHCQVKPRGFSFTLCDDMRVIDRLQVDVHVFVRSATFYFSMITPSLFPSDLKTRS